MRHHLSVREPAWGTSPRWAWVCFWLAAFVFSAFELVGSLRDRHLWDSVLWVIPMLASGWLLVRSLQQQRFLSRLDYLFGALTFALVCLMGGAWFTINTTEVAGGEQVFNGVVAVMMFLAGAMLVQLAVDILRDYGRSKSLYDREENGAEQAS